ncbi:hypothetical protein V6N13_037983 [Hibiscus sabdariffa]
MAMGFGCMLKEVALFAAMFTLTATSVAAQTKPECQSHCGNINIPYPFGTTNGCNISSDFFIRCNTTFNPPKPFLTVPQSETGRLTSYPRFEVLDISLDGHLRIRRNNSVGYNCYNKSIESGEYHILGFYLGIGNFSISHTSNKFTAVGCDTIAFINSSFTRRNYSSGCLTFCGNIADVVDGSCSGIGCCQTDIPKGLMSYYVNFNSRRNNSNVWSFNPCSYGFIVENGAYNFSASDLSNSSFSENKFPIRLDWKIGNKTCREAKTNPESYACKQYSSCVDPENGPGYLCKCLPGFDGNPYLGCQDINECETLKPCNRNGTCQNTPGSYSCSCPEGFIGDGLKNGTGCIPKPSGESFPILVVALGCYLLKHRALGFNHWDMVAL